MEQKTAPVLEMRNITKRFPGVIANDNISLTLHRGEVHSLLGENGAGKSTLMNILYGLQQPDSGGIWMHGKPVRLQSPADAIKHGIGMIHQHFMLVPSLTVAENVALGLRSKRHPLTNLKTVAHRIQELSEKYRLQVDPNAYVWQLAVGERQRVEIIKALYRDASILILDEPTAVLTPPEVDDLFVTFQQMAANGRSMIFISHKLHEVLQLSDRITVLRHGRITGETFPQETDRRQLAQMMVGREVQMAPNKSEVRPGSVMLDIEGLFAPGDRGGDAVRNLRLQVKSGEIVGIAGVSGNGQRELAEAISGLRKPRAGKVQINGTVLRTSCPKSARKAGLAYVPEERMRDGAIGDFNIKENLILLDHGDTKFCRPSGMLRFAKIKEHCNRLVDEFNVKTPDLETPTKHLSGGNIQKLILARELSGNPKVLIAAQPTRGVDIGAAEYIHKRLADERTRGTATVVISEDLDEIMALSDRIAVMYEGEIMGIVERDNASREEIGLMMAGVQRLNAA
ncbi:ABC transporter ATP-binding protein [Desulfopila aestuarii]|uniref:Nucleoside ABC transporter ATP-binding protein n=1 Tax=Desulfopila aestuarii DSM 18488 TaxID=1121416 RepID=A0A1M7YB36_9BACT|nr:ABC transporter ATP-binding protein [Desulfopila aestuarii]SHO49738.1 nucleoside ABC transporter ATP-binding protein [Desulfopila aestuarii DSM 18488]